MQDRLRVLHVAPTFYPATRWGGPIFSTLALCDGLASRGDISLRVLTTDSSGPRRSDRLDTPKAPVAFPAGYDVTYLPKVFGRDVTPSLVHNLLRRMRHIDVVHLTATYSFPTLPTLALAAAFKKPLVWSPRGALQATKEWEGARSKKKALFEAGCRMVLPRQTILHSTSEVEANLSAKALPGIPVAVIPNSVDIPCQVSRPGKAENISLMFLSRLHQKKGLEILLSALADLPAKFALDIYGDGDATYVQSLKSLISELGIPERVTFHGHVDGETKMAAYEKADIFVLPSYSENFGNVVAEALAHGVPVVVSTAAPWSQLEEKGCGLWVPAEKESIQTAIATLAEHDLATMGAAGRAWMQAGFAPTVVANQMAELYRELMARSPGGA